MNIITLLALPISLFFAPAAAPSDAGTRGERGAHATPAERFASMDADSDGKVTLTELEAAKAAHKAKWAGKDGKRAGKDGKRAGKDGKRAGKDGKRAGKDGKQAGKDRPRPTPAQRFAKMDTNSDGGITLEEMTSARGKRGNKRSDSAKGKQNRKGPKGKQGKRGPKAGKKSASRGGKRFAA